MALHFASQQLPVLVTLEGECNKCGLCCTAQKGGVWLFCTHLLVAGQLGTEGATRCLAYEHRYDGMPILMRTADGKEQVFARCHKDSAEETAVIVQKGIGKGCSLRVTQESS
jgi:hypothetical protein